MFLPIVFIIMEVQYVKKKNKSIVYQHSTFKTHGYLCFQYDLAYVTLNKNI